MPGQQPIEEAGDLGARESGGGNPIICNFLGTKLIQQIVGGVGAPFTDRFRKYIFETLHKDHNKLRLLLSFWVEFPISVIGYVPKLMIKPVIPCIPLPETPLTASWLWPAQ